MAGPGALPSGFATRRLTGDDVAAALALSSAVGWSQTAADWRLIVDEGVALGCFDEHDAPAATAAFVTFGKLARVGMVIVAEPFRRRGIARLLVQRIVDDIDTAGLVASLDCRPPLQPF
jgi:GNAT superfamily N-acetyltransferase